MKSVLGRFLPLRREEVRVLVAGMPKSGTTAIAKLLGEAIAKPVCSDPFFQLDQKIGSSYRETLFKGDVSLSYLWRNHRRVFEGAVVKDPNFPLFLEELIALFPEARKVFIVRDPRDNIISILNRLKIDGRQEWSEGLEASLSGAWKLLLTGRTPTMPGDDHLERMAWRWRRSAEEYLKFKDSVQLIRYEDFNKDKQHQICELARACGFLELSDISSKVDVQFQPKGKKFDDWSEFFGQDNLDRIDAIVSPLLGDFGYE
tara:strand:+ start:18028 stop:18804 length:777 start_codon:yes stop_codon:yes gene_type:complete